MTEDEAQSPPLNIGLWVGLGCLGVLVLSCCLLTFWLQSYGLRFILGQGEGTKIWISRVVLVGALEGTRKTCSEGVISEDSLPWFHESVPSETRNLTCSVDEAMLQTLASAEQGSAIALVHTERVGRASGLGLDPTLCFEHQTDDLSAIGCFDIEDNAGSIPYQIIDLSLTPR